MDQLRTGDVGAIIRPIVTENGAPINLSSATKKQLRLKKPSGIVMVVDAAFTTDGSDGKVQYVTVSDTDLDEPGPWKVQAYIEIDGAKWHTTPFPFQLADNL